MTVTMMGIALTPKGLITVGVILDTRAMEFYVPVRGAIVRSSKNCMALRTK